MNEVRATKVTLPSNASSVALPGVLDAHPVVLMERQPLLSTGVAETDSTEVASIIQSRHRIPEIPLNSEQILVLQVPIPEPLRAVESSEFATKKLHAENEYSGAWLMLFEQIVKYGSMSTGADHPVVVKDRYVMSPSPIPRFDNPKPRVRA